MPGEHDAITPLPEFWRILVFVAIGFAVALLLSWTIDASIARYTLGAAGASESHALSR